MATSAATMIARTRRMLRDWPDFDVTTASLSTGATTVTVAATAGLYAANWEIQVDSELMFIRAVAGGTTLTVKRGAKGSTVASHASGASILIRPRFYDVEIVDALNAGINAVFPHIYRPIVDVTLSLVADQYEYTIPNLPAPQSTPIPWLSKVEVKITGDLAYRDFGHWQIRRDATTPKIILKRPFPSGGTFKVTGYGPFPNLTDQSSSLDAMFPQVAEELLVLYASQYLLTSGEAGRTAVDTGAVDNREQANRVGSSIAAGNGFFQRYEALKRQVQMPRLPPHVVSTM